MTNRKYNEILHSLECANQGLIEIKALANDSALVSSIQALIVVVNLINDELFEHTYDHSRDSSD